MKKIEDEGMDSRKAAKVLESSMKEAYLSSLAMIQTFSFAEYSDAASSFEIEPDKAGLIIGALLSHSKSFFEYAGENMGMLPKDVMRGYSYYFYSNVLTDLEEMFDGVEETMNEVKEIQEMFDAKDEEDDD